MKSYKVVKDFACAKKGDILEYNEDTDLFEFEITNKKSTRCMFIDEQTADEYVEDGYLLKILTDEDSEICESCEKLQQIEKTVDALIEQYREDHEDVIEKYNNQEIPTCVKVEADTVYFNMNKILNKIKEIIND